MKKVPIVTVVGLGLFIIIATLALAQESTPNAAGSNPGQQAAEREQQRNRDEAFAQQRDIALAAIDKHELAKADAACNQLLSEFADHPALAQGLYDIARKHGKVGNADKAKQLYEQVMQRWHESEWAIHAQRDVIHAAIKHRDDQATQAELDKLLTNFARHQDIAGTVYNLAKHYDSLSNPEMARRLHDYNVEHYADDIQGMYSQVEIVKSYLASGDDAAVDAACNKLVTTFAQQETLPKEVYQIGTAYSKAGRAERAGVFYRYVLDHWPRSPHAAWARLAVLDDESRGEDDPAVRAALGKLLESLPQQDLSARELYRVARDLARSRPKRALALHRHNGRSSAQDDQYGLWSATELAKAYIRDGNEPAAEQAVNEMTARFAEQETLSTELARIGDTYLEVGQRDKADQLYTYIGNNWANKDDTLWARVGRVRLLITNGDDNSAEAAFQKVLADYAENVSLPDAVRHVGESYYNEALAIQKRLNQERRADSSLPAAAVPMPARVDECFQKASVKFEGLIRKWPNDTANAPFAYHFAGECYGRLGQRDKAIAYYQKVCDTWPAYQYAWHLQFLIGRAYEAQMKANPADRVQIEPLIVAAYERVLKDHPTCPAARAAAGQLQRYAALREGE